MCLYKFLTFKKSWKQIHVTALKLRATARRIIVDMVIVPRTIIHVVFLVFLEDRRKNQKRVISRYRESFCFPELAENQTDPEAPRGLGVLIQLDSRTKIVEIQRLLILAHL